MSEENSVYIVILTFCKQCNVVVFFTAIMITLFLAKCSKNRFKKFFV